MYIRAATDRPAVSTYFVLSPICSVTLFVIAIRFIFNTLQTIQEVFYSKQVLPIINNDSLVVLLVWAENMQVLESLWLWSSQIISYICLQEGVYGRGGWFGSSWYTDNQFYLLSWDEITFLNFGLTYLTLYRTKTELAYPYCVFEICLQ